MSNTGKVSHAWNTSWATSAGWNGASNGNGGGSGARWLHGSRSPALRARRRVSSASAPVMTATSHRPARMVSAASWTSTCGVVPPMPEYRRWRGPIPSAAASRSTGAS
jgi:hypothetical protein